MKGRRIQTVWLISAFYICACSPQGTAPQGERGRASESSPSIKQSSNPASESPKLKFLNRLREADPQHQTIERAVMNQNNELGLVLARNVSMNEIPKLIAGVLKQMAAQFPREDLTVMAYAPANPPIKIGSGHLDARTGKITYTPAQQ
jgi:hypothetical protein